jgi:hypothetical protein
MRKNETKGNSKRTRAERGNANWTPKLNEKLLVKTQILCLMPLK